MGDIATTALNPYTEHNYINLSYNIINHRERYEIVLWGWNRKDIADKTWDAFKAHFCTSHQELKDFSDQNVLDVGFQSENVVAQVVAVISNFLKPTDNDNEDTIIQMANSTKKSTQNLPQLMQ